MNDLTKKTLSVMWDQFKDFMKGISFMILISLLGGLAIFAGAKILYRFRDYFDPYAGLDGCFMISSILMMVLIGIGVLVYTWYNDTRESLIPMGKRYYPKRNFPSGLGGGK